MLLIDGTPKEQPVGLTTGKYAPYAVLLDSKLVNLEAWPADLGGGNTHGVLYPSAYSSTELTLINNNITAMQNYFALDDNIYTAGASKQKVLGNFYNSIKNVSGIGISSDDLVTPVALSATTDASSQVALEVSTNKVIYVYIDSADSSKLKCRVGDLSGKATITLGTEQTIDATSTCQAPFITLISSNKIGITWYAGSTIKLIIGTISGTVVTFGSSANVTTNSNRTIGLAAIGTDKVAAVYSDITTSDTMCMIATCTGTTTITLGTATLIFTGTVTAANSSRINLVCKLDTDKFCCVFTEAATSYQLLAVTVAALVPSPGTAVSIVSNYFGGLVISQLTTDKIFMAGSNSGGSALSTSVITFSGTVATFGTRTTLATISGGTTLPAVIGISATKLVLAAYTTISSVSAMYLWTVNIVGTKQYINDKSSLTEPTGTLANAKMVSTSGYVTAIASDGSALKAYAVNDMNVTIAVNGVNAATSQVVKLYDNLNINTMTYGRKQYIKITNNNATSQTIVVANVICNVD